MSLTPEMVSRGVSRTNASQSSPPFTCLPHHAQFQPLVTFHQGWHPLYPQPLPTTQLSLQGASKGIFLPFLPPEHKAQLLGIRPATLLPALHPHRLLILRGPLPGFAPPMFSVSYRNNQPAPEHMSIETSGSRVHPRRTWCK